LRKPISNSLYAFTITILLIIIALFPWLRPPVYFISFVFTIFMYVSLTSSWNIIGGYAGYLSFGHVAFFGIGCYSTAMIAKAFNLEAFGSVLSTLPAGAIAGLIAMFIGYPCLRLRGPYFAVITLCFAFVAQLAFKNLEITGGPDGLWLKSMDAPIEVSRAVMYELMLVLAIITVSVSIHISKSKFGAGLRAIKEDEEVAQTMAINAPLLKIKAFILSAFFPGVAGGLYGYYLTYIHPDIVFDFNISILIVLMALFGGGGTWIGPVIGAIGLSIINEILSTFVKAEMARIIYGCLFVIVIILMPNGITDFFRRKNRSWRWGN
jgi:branched-chain amino acid transport system permease protein